MKKLLFFPIVLSLSHVLFGQALTLTKSVPPAITGTYFDATFEVSINMSTAFGTIYLDVSEKGGVDKIEILNYYDFDPPYVYKPGEPGLHYNGGGSNTMNAIYYLATAQNTGYAGIGYVIQQNVSPKDAGKVLPWVHTMISNAKRTLLGVHHMISAKYTQNYLDEFCYKVNRRNFGDKLFDRLLIACVTTNYQNIITHYR